MQILIQKGTERLGISASEYIRRLIKEDLKEHGLLPKSE